MDWCPTRRWVLQATGSGLVGGGLCSSGTTAVTAQTRAEVWTEFGYNGNTGHATPNFGIDAGGIFATVTQKWDQSIADPESPPIVVDDTVYACGGDLYCINADTGRNQWVFETDGSVESSPAIADGTVYVGSGDGNVYAVQAASGNEQWTFETGGGIQSSPTVDEGMVYIGSDDGNIYALRADSGDEQWAFETNGKVQSSPTVVDGTVYSGSGDGDLYAIDAETGDLRWFVRIGAETSPAVVDGTVYACSRQSVSAFDAETGDEQWNNAQGHITTTSPTVANESVYVGAEADLWALAADSGTLQWTFETRGYIYRKPAVADGSVLFRNESGILYALGADTGDQRWQYDVKYDVSPVVVDGTVYNGVQALTKGDRTVSVAVGALGVSSLGGAGAWWWTQRGGDDSDAVGSGRTEDQPGVTPTTASSSTAAVGGRSQQATERTATGSAKTSTEILDTATEHHTTGTDQRDAGNYEAAAAAFDEAQAAYEDALERASDSDSIPADEISAKLDALDDDRTELNRNRLQYASESLRDDLSEATKLTDEGDLETARKTLDTLESSLTDVKEEAGEHGFDEIEDKISSLERERQDRLAEVTDKLAAAPIPNEIPRVDNFDVDYGALTDEEHIGGGGNADVSKATVQTPDGPRTIAVKTPRITGTLQKATVEGLLAEAEIWDRLDDHDHIVGVIDYNSEPLPWIAMEYMDGGHLGIRGRAMDLDQKLWTAIAITRGVHHAHRRGVAHLDLKPANVLFRTVDDAWDVPKVADWGLSKELLNHSQSVQGYTPTYAPPEQLDSELGAADDISDVYQLGAVLYELFTGDPPFDGDNAGKIIRKVLDEEPAAPSEVADVPADLDDVLLTALAKDKADRYDSVVLLRNELQQLFDSR